MTARPRYVVFVSGKWRWRPTRDMRRLGFALINFRHEFTEADRLEADRLNAEWDDVRFGRRPKADGTVDVIGFGSYVKIGWTNDLRSRVASLQTGAPDLLTIFSAAPGMPFAGRDR